MIGFVRNSFTGSGIPYGHILRATDARGNKGVKHSKTKDKAFGRCVRLKIMQPYKKKGREQECSTPYYT